jgi:hypothetical protein
MAALDRSRWVGGSEDTCAPRLHSGAALFRPKRAGAVTEAIPHSERCRASDCNADDPRASSQPSCPEGGNLWRGCVVAHGLVGIRHRRDDQLHAQAVRGFPVLALGFLLPNALDERHRREDSL